MVEYAFEKDEQDTGKVAEEYQAVEPTVKKIDYNKTVDIGCLLIEDCQSYADIDATEFSKRTAANICTIYKQLYDMKHE